MGNLTENFDSSEMKCACGCGICNVSPQFIDKLQTTRMLAGIRFIIVSGCRCPSHNQVVGGKPNSDHITTDSIPCEGVDIACRESIQRFRIINAAIHAGFKRIGIGKTFIHLGMSNENPQNVIWLY